MTETSRRLILASRPEGMVDASVVTVETVPVPEPEPGQAVVAVQYLSIDPTIRTWMDDAPGYLPPIELGAVIRSGGIGEVVASASDAYPVGSMPSGMTCPLSSPLSTMAWSCQPSIPNKVAPTG